MGMDNETPRPLVQAILARGWEFELVTWGRSWERDSGDRFVLPELTLGWQVLAFIREYFISNEVDPQTGAPKPLVLSPEQERLILWWYAVDEDGKWLYNQLVVQRLKGWGKDPLAAVISMVELVGPTLFRGWSTFNDPKRDIRVGDPVGTQRLDTWVDIAATTRDQTKNTLQLFSMLLRKDKLQELGLRRTSFKKTGVDGPTQAHFIQAVTSNPGALEGHRTTTTVVNEPHHWDDSNNGTEMWNVIERNGAKLGRVVVITNAPNPQKNSVGLSIRQAEEAVRNGEAFFSKVLYDSLEIHKRHGLVPPEVADWRGLYPEEEPLEAFEQELLTREYLRQALLLARGDSTWFTVEPKIDAILRGTTPEVEARRFWFNQTDSDEESWVPDQCVQAAINPLVKPLRRITSKQVEVGWDVVRPDDEIVIFGDCSKSDDDTGLMGCRLSDGYVFSIGHWTRPADLDPSRPWRVDRREFLETVVAATHRFRVLAVWIDPSHTKDEDRIESYWGSTMLDLHLRLADKLPREFWPVKGGDGQTAVMWDMTSPQRTMEFVRATMDVRAELSHGYAEGYPDPEFQIDGYPGLVRAIRNAQPYQVIKAGNIVGTGIRKEARGSRRKMDLAVCMVGARMLRKVVLSIRAGQEDKSGWGYIA